MSGRSEPCGIAASLLGTERDEKEGEEKKEETTTLGAAEAQA
jgi:hypothetical protein